MGHKPLFPYVDYIIMDKNDLIDNKVPHLSLGPRLDAVMSFIRDGTTLADIGTDHALIPIAACLSGKCTRAYATDVNSGPVERARKNVALYGLSDVITCIKSDGLSWLTETPVSRYDIVIAGMGGETIADIISKNGLIRTPAVRLILQPMTKQEKVRPFLAESGYKTLAEKVVTENGKYYCIICAEYDGAIRSIDDFTAAYGTPEAIIFTSKTDKECYLSHCIEVLLRRAAGKEAAGLTSSAEREFTKRLKEYLGT